MRGHQPLIAMRLQGQIPAQGVVIDAGWDECESWRFWPHQANPRAFVEVGQKEPIEKLDLRFCVGLRVVLVAQPEYEKKRFGELAKKVLATQPKVLTAVRRLPWEPLEVHHWRDGMWARGWPEDELFYKVKENA